ncbi:MAG: VanZ family protein [bacterium]
MIWSGHKKLWSILPVILSVSVILVVVLPPYDFSLQALRDKGGVELLFPGIGESSLADGLRNVLLFFPLGFFCTLLGVSRRWSFFAIAIWIGLTSLILSYWIELIQIFLPGRFPSIIDVFSNTVGGLVGFSVFYLLYREATQRISR